MVLQDRAVIRRDGELPFYSFNPNPLRSTNNMADRACRVIGSATQVGLTQVLGLMDIKSLSLLILAILAVVNGVTSQYPDPDHPSEAAWAVVVVLSALATFAWFRADAIQRSYRRSPLLNVAVFGLAAIALPYYFVRSRGWKQGSVASLRAIGFFIVTLVISVASALATMWIQGPGLQQIG